MEDCALKIDSISKRFGPTLANDHISLTFKKGEIHGLTGENGSGKSTLSTIICGVQKQDSGSMYLNGTLYEPLSPADARNKKVSMVLQEMGIIPNLPGCINMFLGMEKQFEKNGIISSKLILERSQEELKKWDFPDINLQCPASALNIEQRKVIEVVRALINDPDILVLDEVSQALSLDLRLKLHNVMQKLKDKGKTIIFISHDLEEVIQICDSITVLRDGCVVGTKQRNELDLNNLKYMMVGREMKGTYYRGDTGDDISDEVVLSVENLNVENVLHNITFDVHKNEILAICGLSDGGIHELGKAIYGIDIKHSGAVIDKSTNRRIHKPSQFIKAGGVYLSKDRDRDCLMLGATIRDNVYLPSATDNKAFIKPSIPKRIACYAVDKYSIKTENISNLITSLSGGNKQKVNLCRWMLRHPVFAILDSPTRGVDVGVKANIYQLLENEREKGLAIVMICDELAEAMGMADRILVIKDGALQKEFLRKDGFTENALVEAMI